MKIYIKIVVLTIVVFWSLNLKSQGINDVGVIWEKEGTMPITNYALQVKTITLNNGNYVTLFYSSSNFIATGGKDEIYLTEYSETGTVIRQQTITIPVFGGNRAYITSPRMIERGDGKLLVLVEFNHGGGAYDSEQAITKLILTPDNTSGYGGLSGWNVSLSYPNYTFGGHSGHSKLVVSRILDMARVAPNLIAAAAVTYSINGSTISLYRSGLFYIDDDGNITTDTHWANQNDKLQLLTASGEAITILQKEDDQLIAMGQGGFVWITSDIYGSNPTALGAINSACAGCVTTHYGASRIIGDPYSSGYIGIGHTAQETITYHDGRFQLTGWKWNSAGQIQTNPNPFFRVDDMNLKGSIIQLTDKVLLATLQQPCTRGTNATCPDVTTISQIDIGNNSLTLTLGNTLNTVHNQNLTVRSNNMDGVMIGGSNVSKSKITFGKISTCMNYRVVDINDMAVRSGVSTSIQTISATGAFTASTESYSWRAILRKGKLSGGYANKSVGDQLISGNSPIIPTLSFTTEDNDGAVVEIEYTATQHYGNPLMSCSSVGSYNITVSAGIDVVAMPTAKLVGNDLNIQLSIKNLGDSPLTFPFNVTVYKDGLGNATKQVFSHPTVITSKETVRLKFTISDFVTNWIGTPKIVVNLNDDGTQGNGEMVYEIDL